MLKFDDRFARQNRYELPPEFPLASPYSGIVHHLSGPNKYAPTQTSLAAGRSMVHLADPTVHFHCASGFSTLLLAYVLDSLVRVSRRVIENHFASIPAAQISGNPS